MNQQTTIAVLYHIFYEDSSEAICRELKPLHEYHTFFLFNICADTSGKVAIAKVLQDSFPGCFIIITSNKGKDIGGKMALLELFLKLQIDVHYLIFLHDKKSLQALKSATWKNDLLKVISQEGVKKVIEIFQQDSGCGIVATKEYIIKELFEEGNFSGINGRILTGLVLQYHLKVAAYAFVAGTMFWARAKPVKDFFMQHKPLEIRKELEEGNVLDNFSGTVTHSWERLLSWTVTNQGYSINGI